jgi:hypothetical protein
MDTDLELRRKQITGVVERITELEYLVSDSTTFLESLETLENQVNELEGQVTQLTSTPLPPPGLSQEEYVNSLLGFARLPIAKHWTNWGAWTIV